MTYWPVAFIILIAAICLIAQTMKNHTETFLKIAAGSYVLGLVAGFNMFDSADGLGVVFLMAGIIGTVLMLVSLAFYFCWKNF